MNRSRELRTEVAAARADLEAALAEWEDRLDWRRLVQARPLFLVGAAFALGYLASR